LERNLIDGNDSERLEKSSVPESKLFFLVAACKPISLIQRRSHKGNAAVTRRKLANKSDGSLPWKEHEYNKQEVDWFSEDL